MMADQALGEGSRVGSPRREAAFAEAGVSFARKSLTLAMRKDGEAEEFVFRRVAGLC